MVRQMAPDSKHTTLPGGTSEQEYSRARNICSYIRRLIDKSNAGSAKIRDVTNSAT
jgi:hypothetical protein